MQQNQANTAQHWLNTKYSLSKYSSRYDLLFNTGNAFSNWLEYKTATNHLQNTYGGILAMILGYRIHCIKRTVGFL